MGRRAWLDYCLINPTGRRNKFYADDRFGETIIKLNKEFIRPSANAASDRHLREVISLNVLALLKCKEVMARATGATSHGNCHAVVDTKHDVQLVVDHLMEQEAFHEIPGRGVGDQPEKSHTDLFSNGTSKLQLGVPLKRYKLRARGNWAAHAAQQGAADEQGDEVLFDDNLDDLVEADGGDVDTETTEF